MNFKKFLLIIICLVFLASCFYFLIDYIIYTDEERILDILDNCKRGIEGENPILATTYVSRNYLDIYGLSKDDLKKIGEGVFAKFEDFKVIYEKIDVKVESEKASAQISFRIFITYNGQRTFLFGDLNRPASIKLLFDKSKDNEIGWSITGLKDLKSRWPIPAPQNRFAP